MKEHLRVDRITSAEDVAIAFMIRNKVFCCEQKIPAQLDQDSMDREAIHVLAYLNERPVATGRLVVGKNGQGIAARIAVLRGYRSRGVGRMVVRKLEALAEDNGVRSLELHPHYYLEKFYSDLGYRMVSGSEVVGTHRLIVMTKELSGSGANRKANS
jgi:predicted GNAT family N-acyltransferase